MPFHEIIWNTFVFTISQPQKYESLQCWVFQPAKKRRILVKNFYSDESSLPLFWNHDMPTIITSVEHLGFLTFCHFLYLQIVALLLVDIHVDYSLIYWPLFKCILILELYGYHLVKQIVYTIRSSFECFYKDRWSDPFLRAFFSLGECSLMYKCIFSITKQKDIFMQFFFKNFFAKAITAVCHNHVSRLSTTPELNDENFS